MARALLEYVEISGWDRTTTPSEMEKVSKDFTSPDGRSFIEWGTAA